LACTNVFLARDKEDLGRAQGQGTSAGGAAQRGSSVFYTFYLGASYLSRAWGVPGRKYNYVLQPPIWDPPELKMS
jgi:hypothetical protein